MKVWYTDNDILTKWIDICGHGKKPQVYYRWKNSKVQKMCIICSYLYKRECTFVYYINQSPSKKEITQWDKVNEGTLYKSVERTKENQQGMVKHLGANYKLFSCLLSKKTAVRNLAWGAGRELLPEPRVFMGRDAQQELWLSVEEWNHC